MQIVLRSGFLLFIIFISIVGSAKSRSLNYTVIPYNYHRVVQRSDRQLRRVIERLNTIRGKSTSNRAMRLNTEIRTIVATFKNAPYITNGIRGEGDWCSANRRGCAHVQQDPIYRTDEFDCQTFVEVALALLHSSSLPEFQKEILEVDYGSAGLGEAIHYYNRNNFVSADFNPVNQAHGFIRDATASPPFNNHVKQKLAIIRRAHWFRYQRRPAVAKMNVRVIKATSGPAMAKRFGSKYPTILKRLGAKYDSQRVAIDYIPKQLLARRIFGGGLAPNVDTINQLPTPAILEVIRSDDAEYAGAPPLSHVIGSEINVAHLGIIYKKKFKSGEMIYPRIRCRMQRGQKVCSVRRIVCKKKVCSKVMFAHATKAYPNKYYFYKDSRRNDQCTRRRPGKGKPIVYCDRVVSIPLEDYVTQREYSYYAFMNLTAILGVHVEGIL